MQLDPHLLHVAIRWLHVAAMATAFGGAVTVLALSTRPSAELGPAVVNAAIRYEWVFWGAAGVLAMTGIGNVAAFGAGLPGSATPWGTTFVLKLVFVLGLIVLSLPRTFATVRLGGHAFSPRLLRRLRLLYGGTAGGFALVLAFAIWLANG